MELKIERNKNLPPLAWYSQIQNGGGVKRL